MDKLNDIFEEFKVAGSELLGTVKSLVHEGTVRRLIIKDEKGNTFLEIPLTVAAVGVVAVPVLAAVGALSALVAHFTLVVERGKPGAQANPPVDSPISDPKSV